MRGVAMKLRVRLGDGWQWFLTIGLVWLCQTATCLAQAPGEEEDKPKTYVPVYLIIILIVGLALVLICRGARRDDKIRRA